MRSLPMSGSTENLRKLPKLTSCSAISGKATRISKMATLSDSPSLFVGEAWDVWDDAVNNKEGNDADLIDVHQHGPFSFNTDSMKLQRQDVNLFGFCPSQDEFFLVVCDSCGQVVKPQALKAHTETRHRFSSTKSSPAPSSGAHKSSSPAALSTPTPPRSSTPSSKSSSSGKGPPSVENVSKSRTIPDSRSIARSRASPAKSKRDKMDAKLKRNHRMPVVKVERMPSPVTLISTVNSDEVKVEEPCSPLKELISEEILNEIVTQEKAECVEFILEADVSVIPVSSVEEIVEDSSPLRLHSHPVASPLAVALTSMLTSPLVTSPLSSPMMSPLDVSSVADIVNDVLSLVSTAEPTITINTLTTNHNRPVSSCRTEARLPQTSKSRSKYLQNKPDKLLPCKDREYDAEKHCGVWIADLSKPCTRSLTCKTHALSLRRAVPGRSNSFDQLLDEHRAAKESVLRAKAEANGMPFVPSKATARSVLALKKQAEQNHIHGKVVNGMGCVSPLADKSMTASSLYAHLTGHNLPPPSLAHTHTLPSSLVPTPPHKLYKSTKLASNSHLQKPLFSPTILSLPRQDSTPPPELSSRLSSDGDQDEHDDRNDVDFIKFHPRPAASCTFGARMSGHTVVFNRKQDLLRAAFYQAVEKHVHPPPHKKLCVESKLPPEPTPAKESKDPYEFILANSPALPHNLTSAQITLQKAPSATIQTILTAQPTTQTLCTSLLPTQSTTILVAKPPARKSLINRTIKPKELVTATIPAHQVLKRRLSGQSPPSSTNQGVVNISPATPTSATSPLTTPISISIPNTLTVNLASMPGVNTALSDRTMSKNNVVVEPALANGQFLSISSMAELQNNIHLDKKRSKSKQKSVIGNSILTCLPSRTFIMESPSQTHSTALVIGQNQHRNSVSTSHSSPHTRPSPSASPLLSAAISPQVLTNVSPLSNGIISSPSGTASMKSAALAYTLNHHTTAGLGAGGSFMGSGGSSISACVPVPVPSPVRSSPSPQWLSAGEMSPIATIQHTNFTKIKHKSHNRPHKANSRPPAGVEVIAANQLANPSHQPSRFLQTNLQPTIYASQMLASRSLQQIQKQRSNHVTMNLPIGAQSAAMVTAEEPSLKRARPEIHVQNSPSNFIS